MEWIPLETIDQIKDLKEKSKTTKLAIFKHSTSCGISRMVLKGFERELEGPIVSDIKYYLLDLKRNRAVSNAIASEFNVEHQSPQLIVLDKGEVVYAESHNAISSSHCS